MKKLLIVCAALCMAVSAADAKPKKDMRECKNSVKATGDAALRISKAKKNAIKTWQELVINEHGERFINFELARVQEEHCDPARVGGGMGPLNLKRCVIVARPCRSGS